MTSRIVRSGVGVAMVAALFLALSIEPAAHDVPTDMRLQAFFRPEGEQLRLLVRVPYLPMGGIDWPEHPGTGLLDLSRVEGALTQAATDWIVRNFDVYEDNIRLPVPHIAAVRASLPSDPWFGSYEEAFAQVTGPRLPDDTLLPRAQAVLDVLLEYPIRSDRSNFAIEPRFDQLGLRTVTALRFLPAGGAERAFEFHGDPGLVRLDPRWFHAAWHFGVSGFFHILDGIDHLLFLFCLVIPVRRFFALVPIVTSFTVAHTVTLIASAYGMAPAALWFPPLVETLIAASIVYLAAENIGSPKLRHRWLFAFGFGLVHGFSFSFAVSAPLQFAGSHLVASLLSFNIGVEVGQLLVLVLIAPILQLLFRFGVAERVGMTMFSALIAHTSWHWLIERGAVLSQYSFELPALNAAFFAAIVQQLTVLVAAAFATWLVLLLLRQRGERRISDGNPNVPAAEGADTQAASSLVD